MSVDISPDLLKGLLAFVTSGALAALITQLVRALLSLRSGARASNREVIKDLAAARDDAEDRAAKWLRDKDYWRGVAGDYNYQLRAGGKVPEPAEPQSPSERERAAANAPRARRAKRAPTTDAIHRILDE